MVGPSKSQPRTGHGRCAASAGVPARCSGLWTVGSCVWAAKCAGRGSPFQEREDRYCSGLPPRVQAVRVVAAPSAFAAPLRKNNAGAAARLGTWLSLCSATAAAAFAGGAAAAFARRAQRLARLAACAAGVRCNLRIRLGWRMRRRWTRERVPIVFVRQRLHRLRAALDESR